MIALEETLEQQNDLDRLCADRAQITPEIFANNAFYGIDLILKKYVGYSSTSSLKVIVPHGINLTNDKVLEAELQSPLPVIWAYPAYRVQSYLSKIKNYKQVIPTASPFLYLIKLLKHHPQPQRKGTIFFPFHSTHHLTVTMDDEAQAQQLDQLADIYKPITICMYWKDYLLKRHISFQKKGMQIVSAGHIYDPYFLFRFYHLCSLHHYAASNALGSHLFYAVKSGCSYFQLNQYSDYSLQGHQQFLKEFSPPTPTREEQLQTLFSSSHPDATLEQIAIVDRYLGAKFLMSPEQMRQQLIEAEHTYNYCIIKSAVTQLNQNKNAAALKLLEMAIAACPEKPGIQYGKAIALGRMGHTQAAISTLNELLNLMPEHPKARQLLAEIRAVSAKK